MKRKRLFYLTVVIVFILLCNGCLSAKRTDYYSSSGSQLCNFSEDYELKNIKGKPIVNGIDIDYEGLDGSRCIWNICSKGSNKATLSYESKLKAGQARIVLISGKKVTDIIRGNGKGKLSVVLQDGMSIVKCLGNTATGNIKINVRFDGESIVGDEDAQEQAFLSGVTENGTQMIARIIKLDNGNIVAKMYHVFVENGKIAKLATIKIQGKLINGSGVNEFADDGWGHSGIIKYGYADGWIQWIDVKYTAGKELKAEWEFPEGYRGPFDRPVDIALD